LKQYKETPDVDRGLQRIPKTENCQREEKPKYVPTYKGNKQQYKIILDFNNTKKLID